MSDDPTSRQYAAQHQEGMLDNFYDGFANGPYEVRRYYPPPSGEYRGVFRLNTMSWTHCVYDAEGRPVIAGMEEECKRFAERFNLSYAKHIMVKP